MKNSREFLKKRKTASGLTNRLKIFSNEYINYKNGQNRSLKILDIGCGQNCELFKSKADDDRYYGCDFYDKVNENIDEYIKIDLNEESLSKRLEGRKFDIIFCGEVLEHLFSPDDLLDEIKRLMLNGSILILSTPNLAYLPNRLLLLFGISPLFLENSSEFKLGRKYKFLGQSNETEGHIKVFTFGALVDLLKLKEYKIIKIIPSPSAWNIFLDKIICKLPRSCAPNNVFILKRKNYFAKNNNSKSKEHWDNFNKEYSGNWRGTSKESLSQREVGFVNKYLNRTAMRRVLDIGVGNGRIIENLVEKSNDDAEIYGVDLSGKMVEVCQQIFKNEPKVKLIITCDVSEDGICFDNTFDFISAIRVVKYNKNWMEMIEKVQNKMNKNGIFVFSMLNRNSLSSFSDYGIPVYLTSKKEIKTTLKGMNFEVLEISSFSKLPAFLYLYFMDSGFYAKVLIGIEKILEVFFGETFLGKEYFIAVRKK
jgi:2-polyprenyl-3-methyl-5-hydroxy-6-metoxy-1,4-benzoquinol methylase